MIVADYITVDLAQAQACAIVQSKPHKCYPVAIGKPSTPTPKGTFYVEAIATEKEILKYHSAFLGTLLIDIGAAPNDNTRRLALHGTSKPELIGLRVSSGCVRWFNEDIEDLITNYLFNKVIIK